MVRPLATDTTSCNSFWRRVPTAKTPRSPVTHPCTHCVVAWRWAALHQDPLSPPNNPLFSYITDLIPDTSLILFFLSLCLSFSLFLDTQGGAAVSATADKDDSSVTFHTLQKRGFVFTEQVTIADIITTAATFARNPPATPLVLTRISPFPPLCSARLTLSVYPS